MALASRTGEARRGSLSRQTIAEAAVRLVDREGLSSLTMRGLGRELRVEAMSLYSHFSTKEDILNEMVALLFREVAAPPDNPAWEEFSCELFSAFRRVLLSHPNAVPLLCESLTSFAVGSRTNRSVATKPSAGRLRRADCS